MGVTVGSSSPGREASHCGWERVSFAWTTGPGGTASDTVELAGQIVEAVTIPGTAGTHAIRLRDVDNSDVDYLCGSLATVGSDAVQYWQPTISDGGPYRAPVVAGEVEFYASDAAGNSDLTGTTYLFLKT
jgi:hypothetical protein